MHRVGGRGLTSMYRIDRMGDLSVFSCEICDARCVQSDEASKALNIEAL